MNIEQKIDEYLMEDYSELIKDAEEELKFHQNQLSRIKKRVKDIKSSNVKLSSADEKDLQISINDHEEAVENAKDYLKRLKKKQ